MYLGRKWNQLSRGRNLQFVVIQLDGWRLHQPVSSWRFGLSQETQPHDMKHTHLDVYAFFMFSSSTPDLSAPAYVSYLSWVLKTHCSSYISSNFAPSVKHKPIFDTFWNNRIFWHLVKLDPCSQACYCLCEDMGGGRARSPISWQLHWPTGAGTAHWHLIKQIWTLVEHFWCVSACMYR